MKSNKIKSFVALKSFLSKAEELQSSLSVLFFYPWAVGLVTLGDLVWLNINFNIFKYCLNLNIIDSSNFEYRWLR